MLPKPKTCEGCPALHLGKGYVPGEGPRDAPLALVGQGPGEVEAYEGRPFIGPSGRKLNTWLSKARVEREQAWVDNIVRCWLPKNRPPKAAEVEHCTRVHLQGALRKLDQLRVVVPIGLPAGRYFLGPGVGESVAGAIFQRGLPFPSEGD